MPTAAEFRKAAEYLREKPFPVQVREVCALLLAAAAQSEASEDDRLVLGALKAATHAMVTNHESPRWVVTFWSVVTDERGATGAAPTFYAAVLDAARKAGLELDQP